MVIIINLKNNVDSVASAPVSDVARKWAYVERASVGADIYQPSHPRPRPRRSRRFATRNLAYQISCFRMQEAKLVVTYDYEWAREREGVLIKSLT